MNRPVALVALLLAVFGCQRPQEVEPAPPPAPKADAENDRDNVLSLLRGAVVISRTGEQLLENSAVQAIDVDVRTGWKAPPFDPHQTLVFAFPARARIGKVALRTGREGWMYVQTVRVDTSLDGKAWSELATWQLERVSSMQVFEVTAVEANYFRLSVLESKAQWPTLFSIEVLGSFVEPPAAGDTAGCWSVNTFPAVFVERGGRVSGTIEDDGVTRVDGGLDGALYRLAWHRDASWGLAAVTVARTGSHLSGMVWHEEGLKENQAPSWFGEKRSCKAKPIDASSVVQTFLARAKRYPLYALRFDEGDTLVEPFSSGGLETIRAVLGRPSRRIRLVSREYREPTDEQNLARARKRLDVLRVALQKSGVDVARIEFLAAGSSAPRATIEGPAMRALHSVVELETP